MASNARAIAYKRSIYRILSVLVPLEPLDLEDRQPLLETALLLLATLD